MKQLAISLGLALAGLSAATAADAAIVLAFNPSSQHIAIGEAVTVDVTISGLGSEVLSAGDINFVWPSVAMTVSSGSFDCSRMGTGAVCAFDTITPGNVGVQFFSVLDDATLSAQQGDSFTLATLSFMGAADGADVLSLGTDPDTERNLIGLNGLSLTVDVGSACIAVGTGTCNTVPEPASFGLAGLALLGLLPSARRRRAPRD